MYLKLTLVILQLFLNEVSLQSEGDSCTLPNNVQGRCLNIRQCPKAIEELKTRVKPQTCKYDGNDPIVCCPSSNKSKEMCDKYAKKLRRLRIDSIVGGKDAVVAEFPHMVALGFGDKDNIQWKCGGSLISDRFVLTAAHCLRDPLDEEVKYIRMGDIRLDVTSSNRQDFEVIRRIPHPDYKPPIAYNDIALIEIDRTPEYTAHVKPACLHTQSTIDHYSIQATGWGLLNFAGNQSLLLQKVQLDLFTNEECNQSYRSGSRRRLPSGILEKRMVCAGGKDRDVDTCQGDSGGPLQVYLGAQRLYEVVGTTAFGKGCGAANVPSVYNRVSYYVPWIESVVWP